MAMIPKMRPEMACRITGDDGNTLAIAYHKDAVSTKLKKEMDMAIMQDPSSLHMSQRMKAEHDYHREMLFMQHSPMMISKDAAMKAGILGVDMGAQEKCTENPKAQPQQALNNKLLLLI